jgi:hypothetical protein
MKVGKVLKASGMNKMLKQHPDLVYLMGARLVGKDGVVQKVAEQLGVSKGEQINASNVPERKRSPKRRSPAKLLSMNEINALRDAVAQSRKVKRTPKRSAKRSSRRSAPEPTRARATSTRASPPTQTRSPVKRRSSRRE